MPCFYKLKEIASHASLITDTNRSAFAAEVFAKQAEERLTLQQALKCEQMRLAELHAPATSSGKDGDCLDVVVSDSEEEVKFSRTGRSKLVKVEGPFPQGPQTGSCSP